MNNYLYQNKLFTHAIIWLEHFGLFVDLAALSHPHVVLGFVVQEEPCSAMTWRSAMRDVSKLIRETWHTPLFLGVVLCSVGSLGLLRVLESECKRTGRCAYTSSDEHRSGGLQPNSDGLQLCVFKEWDWKMCLYFV